MKLGLIYLDFGIFLASFQNFQDFQHTFGVTFTNDIYNILSDNFLYLMHRFPIAKQAIYRPPPHFRESSYAYPWFKNGTILLVEVMVVKPPSLPLHPNIKERQQQPPSTPKTQPYFACCVQRGRYIHFQKGQRAHSGVKFNFQSIGTHYRHGGRIRAAH